MAEKFRIQRIYKLDTTPYTPDAYVVVDKGMDPTTERDYPLYKIPLSELRVLDDVQDDKCYVRRHGSWEAVSSEVAEGEDVAVSSNAVVNYVNEKLGDVESLLAAL